MLLFGSISPLHICILLSLTIAIKGQYYGSDYSVTDDVDHDDQSSYDADNSKTDYSKYYNNDGASAPLISSPFLGELNNEKESDGGFVTPLDFSGFFPSAQFGAATNQESSISANPSQNIFQFQNDLKKPSSAGFVDGSDFSASFTNIPNFEAEVSKNFDDNSFQTKSPQPYIAPNPKSKSEIDDLNNYQKPKYKESLTKNYNKNLDYKPKTYTPLVPTLSSYTAGKINHLAPVKTYVPQYFPVTQNAKLGLQTLPTYQNYNYKPSINLSNLAALQSSATLTTNPISTQYGSDYGSASELAQPSEYKSQKVQDSNCQQVEKQLSPEDISHGRFRRQADKMNCFMCKDPKSGGTYEKCSYTSNPEDDQSYFRGHAEKYRTKTYSDPEEHSRKKRDTRSKKKRDENNEGVDDYENPFNYEKSNSHKFNSKPAEFDDSESYYQAPNFDHYEKDSENYRFGPEYFTDSTNQEKSYSELQSENLKKSAENCKKVQKDSMTCMVCSNPKTGGNYEQCSYTSEPKEKKYAFVKEKKYNSNNPDGEEKFVESTETKPLIQKDKLKQYKPSSVDDEPNYFSASNKDVKQANHDDYYIPHHLFNTKEQKQKTRDVGYFGQDKTADKSNTGEYVYKLFPEYAEKESKNQEIKEKPGFQYKSDLPEYFTAEESKKDVDTVLQEFTKKDRSKCKKITKDKMTCYVCLDDKGVQHEECMFVSESQPKSSHIAYHEVKEFTSDPKKEEVTSDTKPIPEVKSISEIKQEIKKAFPKKVPSTPIPIKEVDAEPTEYIKIVGKKPRIVRRRTNNDDLSDERKESNHKAQKESPDGAYATDLRPVYSKELGLTLPAYMLEISEGEKIFDEAVTTGR